MARRHIYLGFLICCYICAQSSSAAAGRFNGWRRDLVNYFQDNDDGVTPEQKQKYQVCLASCSPGPAPPLAPSNRTKRLRIVGGRNVEPGEFPYNVRVIVSTGKASSILCSGAIIDEFHILSAAHCFRPCDGKPEIQAEDVRVALGEHTIDVKGDGELISTISKLTVHPDYQPACLAAPSKFDLAILRTPERIVFKQTESGYGSVGPIDLPAGHKQDYTPGQQAIITGWGRTDTGKRARILQVAEVSLSDIEHCRWSWENQGVSSKSHICAHKLGAKESSCYGDSGGPLAVMGANGKLELIGIVSFGDEICSNQMPTVYIRVSAYLSWIAANTSD